MVALHEDSAWRQKWRTARPLLVAVVLGFVVGCGPGGYAPDALDSGPNKEAQPDQEPGCAKGETRDCYSADPPSRGVGVCTGGTRTCEHGSFGGCEGEVTPRPEACNGLDDDCDGSVDEGCRCGEGETRSCYSGNPSTRSVGACDDGVQRCVDGLWRACKNEILPSAELCDGIDNDCDGAVDDANPGAGESCDTGLLGACAAGVESCVQGHIECLAALASAREICDGVDNDCDGAVDEDSPGTGDECDTGLLGACSSGTVRCVDGSLRCVQRELASREVCDGIDNDCDGVVDEGLPSGSSHCDTGLLGVCASGTLVCSEGVLECIQDTAQASETCNDLDDDCDGHTDEGCCTHSVCEAGNGLSASCGSCVAAVCSEDPYCCDFEWDNLCIGRVRSACSNSGCAAPGNCIHALCVEGAALSPSCDPDECVQAICAADEACCSASWDSTCVGEVASICAGDCSFE